MANNKAKPFLLIEILESFSERDLEKLTRFVASTYFNTDKYAVKLLEVLKESIINKKRLDDEAQGMIYHRVFSDLSQGKTVLNKKQKATFNAKMNVLTRLAEKFLTVEALNENDISDVLLNNKLLEKKLFRLLERRIRRNRQQTTAIKDANHYIHKYQMETNVLNYLHHKGVLDKQDNLPELNLNLDVYYVLNKLNLHTTALSLMDVYASKEYDFADMKAIKVLLDLPQYSGHPLIQLHLAIIDLLTHKAHTDYSKLLEMIEGHKAVIPTDDLHAAYVVATNFCAEQITLGNLDYYRYHFELYRIMDNNNLLLEENTITPGKLKNMVSVSCRTDEFGWAIQMIHKYCPFLKKGLRDNIYNFNLGKIAFYQKDYQEAIDYLYRIDNIDLDHDINRRMIMIKSYYELENEYKETTAQVFRSAEKYIQECKSLTFKKRKAYKNFIRILINLYRIRHRASKMDIETIKKKLENVVYISDKNWLLEKIDEF